MTISTVDLNENNDTVMIVVFLFKSILQILKAYPPVSFLAIQLKACEGNTLSI